MFLCERWCAVSREDIAGIVTFKDGMIIFTSFVIYRVGTSTQYAFGWGIAWFCAGSAVLMTASFYTGIWLVTLFLCVFARVWENSQKKNIKIRYT